MISAVYQVTSLLLSPPSVTQAQGQNLGGGGRQGQRVERLIGRANSAFTARGKHFCGVKRLDLLLLLRRPFFVLLLLLLLALHLLLHHRLVLHSWVDHGTPLSLLGASALVHAYSREQEPAAFNVSTCSTSTRVTCRPTSA
eukprot:746375-Hanusia_phi.AAC.1